MVFLQYESAHYALQFEIVTKGGFKSEDAEGFSNLPKYIPFSILNLSKLFYPVHGIDEILITLDLLQVRKYCNLKM